MSYTNCRSRKTSKRALNGAHRTAAPRGERGGFEVQAPPERSMGAAAPTALMTQYADGQLMTRELQDMMGSEREHAAFDREFIDDIDRLVGLSWGRYADE